MRKCMLFGLLCLSLTVFCAGTQKNAEQEKSFFSRLFNPDTGIKFNFPYGEHQQVNGAEVGLMNKTEELKGLGLGAVSYHAEEIKGLVLSGFKAVTGGDFNGLGLGGLNVTSGGDFNGLGISGIKTKCGDDLLGCFVSGIGSRVEGVVNGLQISGLDSKAEKVNGVQMSLFNRTEDLNGIQIGLLNKAPDGLLPWMPIINIGH